MFGICLGHVWDDLGMVWDDLEMIWGEFGRTVECFGHDLGMILG
jgi:hypothetical protein